jgi:hypothetical protein
VNRVFGIKTARERWKTFDSPDEPEPSAVDPEPVQTSEIADGSDPWA